MGKHNIEAVYPLSPMQQGMLFHTLYAPASGIYFEQLLCTLDVGLNISAFRRAWQRVVERHAVLRTFFAWERRDRPLQIVRERVELPWEEYDWQGLSQAEQRERLESFLEAERKRGFSLTEAPLMRLTLIHKAEETYQFIWSFHHILMDGWCGPVILREVLAFYEAFCRGEDLRLKIPRPYRDHIIWLQQQDLSRAETFWRETLKGFTAPTPLEMDGTSRGLPDQAEGYDEQRIRLSTVTTAALRSFARRHQLTLNTLVQGAWALLLSRHSGEEDVVFGATVSGRPADLAGVESMIGLFVNTLPMRVQVSPRSSLLPWLKGLQDQQVELRQYEYTPLIEVQGWSQVSRGTPLFESILVFENYPMDTSLGRQNESLRVRDVRAVEKTNYPLTVVAGPGAELLLRLLYDSRRFDAATITRMLGHFKTLLEGIIANPERCLSDLPLLTDAERYQLLVEWNDTETAYPQGQCIHELFEAQVERTPDAVAVVFPSTGPSAGSGQRSGRGEDHHLTYRELNRRANQLAHYLRALGVGPEGVVGICMECSLEMMVGILGILKAEAAYMPIDPRYPEERVLFILDDSGASLLLTKEKIAGHFSFTSLQNIKAGNVEPVITLPRSQIKDFDGLPKPDRTLVNYEAYHRYIGYGPVKHTVSLQASRGCPFNCLYCHRVWPKKHVVRSAENIFEEICWCYDAGVKRFVFIDDIFNLDKKNSDRLLQEIIKHDLDVQLFFPNGLRGDILTKDFIDLMIEAGTVDIDVALETASPRIQRLMRKNLNLERFQDNVNYIIQEHPHVILEMELMLGFPTETEEEAFLTLDFLKSLKWVHFPNLNILKIFPNTDIYRFAVESGISEEAIERSTGLAYHELPETLPFSKSFTRQYQARFMSEYFLLKERLLHVLPAQMRILTEDELIQKYDSYLPAKIKSLSDILQLAGISEKELGDVEFLPADSMSAPDFCGKIERYFPTEEKDDDAFRVLLLDLSLLFSAEAEDVLYDIVEAPLGLMYLMTYINEEFDKVLGKVAKSRIDFDSFKELKSLMDDFRPQVIGIRTLSLYKDFFHKTVSLIKQWFPGVPIITGGPYATSDYNTILADRNVDVVVLGEGELTFSELIGKIMENGGQLPGDDVLEQISGLVFVPQQCAEFRETADASRKVLLLDRIADEIASEETGNLDKENNMADLAYVMYTSGSTGRPKGVTMRHRPLTNLMYWQGQATTLDQPARTLQFASSSFDVSCQEIFFTWSSGGTLVLTSEDTRRDAAALLKVLDEVSIERLFLPFVALQHLAQVVGDRDAAVPKKLREVITAGEQLQITPHIERLFERLDGCILHNQYGPTEAHVVTALTLKEAPETWVRLPPIGRPIANARIHVLDAHLQPVPIGAPGELYIGGVCLARGYLNRPGLTAEKFIPDLFSNEPGARLYRTGDLCRYLSDGNIGFLGRIDHQVKARGFRVELGEIEVVLGQHPMVRETAVLAREDEPGEKRLVAYVVANDGQEPTVSGLRRFLQAKLPDYMVPSAFVLLQELPLTPNGKVNRRALPVPERVRPEMEEEFVAPRTPIEEAMAGIWAEILKLERVGVHDNFFDLGGHSLLATQVMSRVCDSFQVELPLRTLFEVSTIAGLAKHVEEARGWEQGLPAPPLMPVARDGELPLSFAQQRLWFLDQLEPGNNTYNIPAAVRLTGPLNVAALEQSLNEITRRHEALRTIFPMVNGRAMQAIIPALTVPLPMVDLRKFPEAKREPEARRLAAEEAQRPFDLAQGPLARATLLRLSEEEHVLLSTMHHIVSDGWSVGVLIREMAALYQAYASGQRSPLVPLPIQYGDFAVWQREWLRGEVLEEQLGYWKQQLDGAPVVLELPTDRSRPPVHSYRGAGKSFVLSEGLAEGLKALSRAEGCTLFMTLLAAFKTLLYCYSGQEDIVVGSPIANRNRSEIEGLIGFFVNTLVLRTDLGGDPSFRQLLGRVQEVTLEAYTHQDLPFEKLVEELQPERDLSRNPLFQVMFVLQNAPMPALSLSGLSLTLLELTAETTVFDLILSMVDTEQGLMGTLIYNTDLFDSSTMTQMLDHFRTILKEVVARPEWRLLDIPLLRDEKDSLVEDAFSLPVGEAERFDFQL